jgi:hypothetical protein
MQTARTTTPIAPVSAIATRQSVREPSAPPNAGPTICPSISALVNIAMLAPRPAAPPEIAKEYIPTVFVRAETEPINIDATTAWASEAEVASRTLDAASAPPAIANATAGATPAASRPAGRSTSRRPAPKAVVSSPISPTVSDSSPPSSGSRGTRENAAVEIANTIPPTMIGEATRGRVRL